MTALLHQISAYCTRRQVPESAFGRIAVNDPRLVSDLRHGRQPGPRITEKVLTVIEGRTAPAKHTTTATPRASAQGRKRGRGAPVRYITRCADPHPILAEISRFLAVSRMPESTFGQLALRDPNLVEDIRCGRDVRRVTAQRIRNFMAAETRQ